MGFDDLPCKRMFAAPYQDLQCFHGIASGRPYYKLKKGMHDTSTLNGYIDIYDGATFAEALVIFRECLNHQNVALDTCRVECASSESMEAHEVTTLDMKLNPANLSRAKLLDGDVHAVSFSAASDNDAPCRDDCRESVRARSQECRHYDRSCIRNWVE